jgi:hypothetical protein
MIGEYGVCDDRGVFCMSPKKYTTRMHDNYVYLFGTKAKLNVFSPLDKGNHPEFDTSILLNMEDYRNTNPSLVPCNGQYPLVGSTSLLPFDHVVIWISTSNRTLRMG